MNKASVKTAATVSIIVCFLAGRLPAEAQISNTAVNAPPATVVGVPAPTPANWSTSDWTNPAPAAAGSQSGTQQNPSPAGSVPQQDAGASGSNAGQSAGGGNSGGTAEGSNAGGTAEGSNSATQGIFYIQNPLSSQYSTVGGLVDGFVQIFTYLAVIWAVIMIIYVGLRFVLAQGNRDEIIKRKDQLLWLAVGVALIIGARIIVQVVINTLQSTGVSSGVITNADKAINSQ